MCAWKRGTQNNLPGIIRKGHIKEFLLQSTSKETLIIGKLKNLDMEQYYLKELEIATAYICTIENGLPESFHPYVLNNVLYLHAHEYPRSILTAVLNDSVPYGSILLNQTQRVNNKVCIGELQDWSIFNGDVTMYDCREGSIGNHSKTISTKPPSIIKQLILEISLYDKNDSLDMKTNENLSCVSISKSFTKSLCHCVVTIDDIYVVYLHGIAIVGRVIELLPDEEHDDEYVLPDNYRGVVDEFTNVYAIPNMNIPDSKLFLDIPMIPDKPMLLDIVEIYTSDQEMFPVKRKLLRPCISLTSVVQAGKGKYQTNHEHLLQQSNEEVKQYSNSNSNQTSIDVDACTFDRVLLYLEHEARGEEFQFDPLLANELRDAAIILGVTGLRDVCDKVLGSFQERVRRTPIRLSEVLNRNASGGINNNINYNNINNINNNNDIHDDNKSIITLKDKKLRSETSQKRSETLLLMSGMVFDITRWLDEHPGGSTIIPEQALNVDCTIFFEIYHASRQSFLYLKEFYIGELSLEDRPFVKYPNQHLYSNLNHNINSNIDNNNSNNKASDAFMEQLHRITSSWRLDIHTMESCKELHKSF